ncbi:MAG: fructosamine kinase family protein [Gemmatimonadota bacterium]
MTLPGEVRRSVEAALAAASGRGATIDRLRPVGGGCISPTARIELDTGDAFFLKWGQAGLPTGLLAAEARGLRQLRQADAVRVPEVIGSGDDGPGWLLLEWLEPGAATRDAWARLGRELAELHGHRAPAFGADEPNYIGALPQANGRLEDWASFWRDRRLEPQLAQAESAGLADPGERRRFDALYERLPELLGPAGEDGPSLLHGDLWDGNVHMMADGTPALIDPSVYHGHREVDLAMAELFGGFGAGFREAYEERWPLLPGYAPVRRAVYQLYYLLVHVNLFGRSYLSGTRRALDAAGV